MVTGALGSAVEDSHTEDGLLYASGEPYWDSIGFYIGLVVNLLHTNRVQSLSESIGPLLCKYE